MFVRSLAGLFLCFTLVAALVLPGPSHAMSLSDSPLPSDNKRGIRCSISPINEPRERRQISATCHFAVFLCMFLRDSKEPHARTNAASRGQQCMSFFDEIDVAPYQVVTADDNLSPPLSRVTRPSSRLQ